MGRTLIPDASLLEIREMLALIPKKGTAAEERKQINTAVRERLPKLSNDAVAYLAIQHHLFFLELVRRLEKGQLLLPELFRLVKLQRTECIHPPKKLWPLAIAEIKRVGLKADPGEIAELAQDWEHTELNGDFCLIGTIVAARTDNNFLCSMIPENQRQTFF